MEKHFFLGAHVKLVNNIHAVEITYKIIDFNIFLREGRTSIRFLCRAIKDYDHPDGGRYTTNHVSEWKAEELTPAVEELTLKHLV